MASKTKSSPKRGSSTRRATTAPKGRQSSNRIKPEEIRQKNQVRSVVLFACSIFLACLILVKGDNLWRWAHDLLLGMFGGWAILGPILMIYIAIITSMGRQTKPLTAKIWMCVIINLLCCATGFVFSGKSVPEGLNFFKGIQYLYQNNTAVGGGVTGGLLGIMLQSAFGVSGAKIVVVLLLFVFVMILTGTTLIQLLRGVQRPVRAVSDGIASSRQKREEIVRQDEIDIPIADVLPAHPVRAELPQVFERPKEKKKKEKNEKLDKLKSVFGITEETPVKPQPVEVGSASIGVNTDEDDWFAGQAQNQENTREIQSIATPIATVGKPKKDVLQEETKQPDIPHQDHLDVQIARDAEKAAAAFVKKHEENEKKELTTASEGIMQNADTPVAYLRPPVTMLEAGKKLNPAIETDELQTNGRILVETLKSFGVQTKILDICRGPSVTRYELQPAAGVKISKITNLSDDLAMNLAATGVRIEAPIPGKAAVGIEVPNKTKSIVRMRELIESNSFVMAKSKLSVSLGRDIAGQVVVADLAKMPHLLIAGTTGSGKSVCINSLIVSTLFKASPDEVRFLMIDPKVVELGIYNGIPHLLVPVVTDPRKAAGALGWAVTEMLNRYKIFADNNVRDLEGYNQLAASMHFQDENGQPMLKMPQIVILIDELSDLMMAAPNEVEDAICRLAQMARAAGMHLVVATQRPSVDVVTGLIKANIPSRIAFAVSSAVDSRTILDGGGAEKLLGQGDMLFSPVGASKPLRVQGCYVSDSEIESIVSFVKQSSVQEYDKHVIDEIERNAVAETGKNAESNSDAMTDPMMEEAIKCVVEAGQASTSLLQRRLRLGYARAGRLVDQMEQMGIVGPHEGSKPRQVLMTYGQWLERNMQKSDERAPEP